MAITVYCPNPKCGVRLTVGDDRAEEMIVCPKPGCNERIPIPATSLPVSEPAQGKTPTPFPAPQEFSPTTPTQTAPTYRRRVVVSFVIGLLIGGFCVGVWMKEFVSKSQTVAVVKEVPVEVIKEVVKEVPVEVVREVIRERSDTPKATDIKKDTAVVTHVEDVKPQDLPDDNFKIGGVYRMFNGGEGAAVKVLEVVDDKSAIVQLEFGRTAYPQKILMMIPTNGIVDGQYYQEALNSAWKITGTKKAKGRTVFVMEQVNVSVKKKS